MGVDTVNTGDGISLGAIGELAVYHLRRASSVSGNDFARATLGTGVRQILFGILSVIDANPGINQGTVGKVLGIQRANMVSLINELVDGGLLDRQMSRGDRRAFCLTLTDAGKRAIEDNLARVREREEQLLADFDANERRTLIDMLQRIGAREDA